MPHAERDSALRRMTHTVLMPGFVGTRVPEWLARAARLGLGAATCFAANLTVDAAALTTSLRQRHSGLIVAADEEGGAVTRLDAATGSPYPSHRELGLIDDPARTRAVAHAIGQRLRAAGIDTGLAPVADIDSAAHNPVIGTRSFGADPQVVARHVTAFIAGCRSSGVAAAVKHFPGHGATSTDSHLALPVIDIDTQTLHRRELVPFAAAVDADVEMVMVGHILIPALDPAAPASVCPRAYTLLREELSFNGVAVTDALDMQGLTLHMGGATLAESVARGAVAALRAGADLVCLGNPHDAPGQDETIFRATLRAVLGAVADGTLPVERLAGAAGRVHTLAASLPLDSQAENRTRGALS
ncbi:hypothetical protein GCM10022402_00850 [Salinactinospora qingdaonensis]|uniref:Glycoside hydrolase family 3 N-terminal domain-containing protein n=1 Tax=Salinactinospora qingdaonensis TaxID=702744 RepID=A0ABP7ESH0_9ACTN